MTTPIRLSICMPTYNFGEFIGPTLENVMAQVVEGVEVVVLDGGSTDDTTAVVTAIQERHDGLRYHRRPERGGIDRDMARTVALAEGEYCWLVCADDLLTPGAIARMLDEIRGGLDLYLCGMTLCTYDMQPMMEHPILAPPTDGEFDLADDTDRRRYFERAMTTTAFFSFAGSLCVRKDRWDELELDEDFVGSCWAHVARIFALIPRGLRVKYLADPFLLKRSDNDSFMDRGLVNRYAIAIDGYHRLADAFFAADSFEARHIRRVVTNEFPAWVLMNAKSDLVRDGRSEELPTLDRLAAKAYGDGSPRSRATHLTYRLTPLPLYRAVRATVRRVRSLRAALSSRRRR